MAHCSLLPSPTVSAFVSRCPAPQSLKAAESWQRTVKLGSMQNTGLCSIPWLWQGIAVFNEASALAFGRVGKGQSLLMLPPENSQNVD